jgi:hypothetical protein
VHRVGARAAELAGNVRVLEATGPRELMLWLFGPARALRLVEHYSVSEARAGFSPRAAITHRVNVRRFAARKQAALAAHRSQVYGRGRAGRLFRLPAPVFGLLCGQEWFTEAPVRR